MVQGSSGGFKAATIYQLIWKYFDILTTGRAKSCLVSVGGRCCTPQWGSACPALGLCGWADQAPHIRVTSGVWTPFPEPGPNHYSSPFISEGKNQSPLMTFHWPPCHLLQPRLGWSKTHECGDHSPYWSCNKSQLKSNTISPLVDSFFPTKLVFHICHSARHQGPHIYECKSLLYQIFAWNSVGENWMNNSFGRMTWVLRFF